MTKSTGRKIVFVLIGLFLLGICSICSYFTAFRYADASFCYPKVAGKIGTDEANQNKIYQYIKKEIQPGMSKNEVMSKLNELGPAVTTGTSRLYDGTIGESVSLNICC